MTDIPPSADGNTPAPMLTPIEARVLGSLMEKQLATPEQYPLTLSLLVAACNQKSNRDPVLQLGTEVVEQTLNILRREKKLAVMVHEAGARVPKFRQELTESFGLNDVEQAVLAELLLRGPQTVAELRTRVPRMVPSLEDGAVEAALEAIEVLRGIPFVRKLPRAHGRRESRFAHQLCGEVTAESEDNPLVIEAPKPLEAAKIEALEQEVQTLKQELLDLKQAFIEFKRSFEG